MKRVSVAVLVMIALCAFSGVQAESSYITVMGNSEVSMVPEDVTINVPIQINNKEYDVCHQELITMTNKISADLKKAGIKQEQIVVQGLYINTDFRYESGKRVDNGYVGSISVMVKGTFSNAFVNKVIQVLSNNSCSYNVRFSLSDKQNEELRLLALDGAMKDAYANAKQLAQSANVGVGEIVSINYTNGNGGMENPMYVENVPRSYKAASSNSISLSPDKIVVNKSIVVRYRLLVNLQ